MGLREYKRKRDFQKTREPAGRKEKPSKENPKFVVQKHRASRLHYDVRLEMEGVLRSWAVPKGPSLRPHDKRLAVQVEDHPMEYADFEGVIPEGEYGAGKVIVWDRGRYEYSGVERDEVDAWRKGELEFRLRGQKLKGHWMLVKMKGRGDNQWLLFKKEDRYAEPATDITKDAPESVVSGREVDEVGEEQSVTWHTRVQRLLQELQIVPSEIRGRIRPMLPTLTDAVPEGANWIYEMKYDGIRALAVKKKVSLSFTLET